MAGISDDELKGAFRNAFPDADPEHSVLASMEQQGKSVPRVLLRDLEEESQVLKPRGGREGRYQVVGEIARGGVGVVLKGRDIDLGRDVAMKVLRDEHSENGEVVQRFVEEAQIGGQLQHPGIIPIYEMGLNEEKRPYFTMKLVKGQTLAVHLRDRKSPRQRLRRLLTIFERVCDAVGYAHSRGVVHRDLKPANIIIGAYAEVQVVDWGFAKVLGREHPARARPEQTVVSTVRTEGGSQSMAGSVFGTPAYMPPEQALGQVESLDERSDVFALGAILCELLTGKPPYVGETLGEILVQAQRGDLKEVKKRLGTDALAPLVLECLAAGQSRRPADAGVVAERIREHMASIEDRARASRIAAAEQRARAVQERRARRVVFSIAATILFVLVGGGATWMWKSQRDQERTREVSERVRTLLDDARVAQGQGRWVAAEQDAIEAGTRAQSEYAEVGLEEAAADLLAVVQQGKAAAEAVAAQRLEEREMLGRWAETMTRSGDQWDPEVLDRETMEWLEQLGSLEGRPAGFKRQVAERLEFLAVIRQEELPDLEFKPLLEHAKGLDPDPVRNAMRELLLAEDKEGLEALARTEPLDERINARNLATALRHYGSPTDLQLHLRRLDVKRNPGGIFGDMQLGQALAQAGRTEEARRHYMAALAVRPRSAECRHNLLALESNVRERIALMRDAVRVRPGYGHGWYHLAFDLQTTGQPQEAMAAARKAIELTPTEDNYYALEFVVGAQKGPADVLRVQKRGLELLREKDKPTKRLKLRLASSLFAAGEKKEALALVRRVAESWPVRTAWIELAKLLSTAGDTAASQEACREALRLEERPNHPHLASLLALLPAPEAAASFRGLTKRWPNNTAAWYHLGLALIKTGEREKATEAFLQCLEIMPEYEQVYYRLSEAKLLPNDELIARARSALRRNKDSPRMLFALGTLCLWYGGDPDEGIQAFTRALEISPNVYSSLHLATFMNMRGPSDRAIEILQDAVRADPGKALLWNALGSTYERRANEGQGEAREAAKREAIEAYRRTLAIDRLHRGAWWGYERLAPADEVEAYLDEVMRHLSHAAMPWWVRGWMLEQEFRADGDEATRRKAIAAYRRAIANDPDYDDGIYYQLSRLFEGEDRLAVLQEGLRAFPGNARLELLVAKLLSAIGDQDGAADAYRRALVSDEENLEAWGSWIEDGQPEDVQAHLAKARARRPESAALWYAQGLLLTELDKKDEAIAAYREAVERNPRISRYLYVRYVQLLEDDEEAIGVLQQGIEHFPDQAVPRAHLVARLHAAGRTEEARATLNAAPLASAEAYREMVEVTGRLPRELALPLIRRGIELYPEEAYLHMHLGLELKSQEEDTQVAIAALDKAVGIDGEGRISPYWLWFVAECLYGLGAEDQARRAFAKLLATEGTGAPDHLALAWVRAHGPLEDLRDPKRAVAHAQRAVESSPTAAARGALGYAWYRAGDYQRAIGFLEPSVAQLPDGEPRKLRLAFLAMSQWKVGRQEEARASLQAARAIEHVRRGSTLTDRAMAEAEAMIR